MVIKTIYVYIDAIPKGRDFSFSAYDETYNHPRKEKSLRIILFCMFSTLGLVIKSNED